MITMSALPRLLNCPSSAVLSKAENASVYADAGHDEHAELAQLDSLPEEYAHLVPAGARSEVKVAYDVVARTGRIIGEGDGRGYGSLGVYEIPGSIDVLGIDGDIVVVLDWKTGYRDVDPAERNWQLWGYGIAAANALGKSQVRLVIVYTKTGRVDIAEIGALELADFAFQLAMLHEREAELRARKTRGELLDTKEGSWCRYCPSKHVCPSKNALLVQIAKVGLASEIVRSHGVTPEAIESFEQVVGESLALLGDAAMTPDRARAAYHQFVRIEQIVADAKKRLDTYVDENGPIGLGDGRAYGRYVRKGRKQLDGDIAVQAIREVVGESAKEFEAMAIERSTTQAAIERAAKQFAPARGASKLKTAIVNRIDELGGVTYSNESMPIGEHAIDKSATRPAIDFDAVDKLLKETA